LHFFANPRIGFVKSADAAPICCGSLLPRVPGYSAWKSFKRFGNIPGDVDLDSDAGVTVALQLTSILAWTLTLILGSECPFDMRFQRPDNSHTRKQHGSAIFGGIDEHLDS
jgi:hypothetical protein